MASRNLLPVTVFIDGYEGKRLFICASYTRTSVFYRLQEFYHLTLLLSPSFLSSQIFKSVPPTNFSHLSRRSPLFLASSNRILFELTYFSEAFVRTAKTAIASIERQRTGKKKGRKSVRATGGIVKRAMRVLNDLRGPQLVELFVLPVRRMATGDARERSG